ncbi:PilW family protein [Desulfofundulus thermosubterraneus]|uniref:Prepilin-type N-terminal cleavage/methylation domain-containing protein n=1 Tax=Desulfofundulus thermosubterraneus DSM 16057 TaxID=1121432 RepID=A0A1M6GGT3_9FIRM|nr:prepilin-type N-terminal cleavage/methylation domain-containing protein [Desulfofundulus thermosubterraneus]SHJ09139.1 prepilin-type N-terminal cleavage/methylation domain-containing protein [Desulfofundulus thermosubterraneus DSM 16057]
MGPVKKIAVRRAVSDNSVGIIAKGPGQSKYGTADTPASGWRAALLGLALDRRGLTLIEVLVTAVLLSLILGAAYFVVDSTMLNWKKGDEQVDVQQNLRLAMDRLTRELRVSAGVDEINPQSYIIFKSPDNAKYIKYYLYGGEIKRATSSNKIIWEGDNPVAGRVQAVSFQGVTGLPATVEIKLTGTNGFVLTSRVTVRMMREQN